MVRVRARIRIRVRVRIHNPSQGPGKTGGGGVAQCNFPTLDHQVGYLKIPIYFWGGEIFGGHRLPRPLWLCFQQPVMMWLFGATYSSITYKLFVFTLLNFFYL